MAFNRSYFSPLRAILAPVQKHFEAQLIALGFHHFERSMNGDAVSIYHVQAAIAATHARASSLQSTNWPMILEFYDHLMAINASPVVALAFL